VAEQRYLAVLAVISDGLSISQVAEKVGVSRQTLHAWLARMRCRASRAGGSVASAGVVSASDVGGGRGRGSGATPLAAALGAAAAGV
jgi:transposase